MKPDTLIYWLPFIGSIIVVVLGYLFGRRKQGADIVSEMADAAKNLIEPLNRRIGALEKTVKDQAIELNDLLRGINLLIEQIRCLGQEPVWTPETKARNMRKNLSG